MPSDDSSDLSQHRGQLLLFIKSLANFSGDLSQISAPAFLLAPVSFVEFPSFWTDRPSLYVAPADEPDPEKRAYLVLKWYLCSLIRQFARQDKITGKKKPMNPFLGELFLGKTQDDKGTTEVISEQVSHHPPVTAFYISNPTHNVILEGTLARKANFQGAIVMKQTGFALYKLPSFSETHLLTLPSARLEGLIYGKPHIELTDTSYIFSSSGFTSKITYSGKGWLSGKRNSFKAVLYPNGDEDNILYSFSGQWSGTFEIRRGDFQQPVIETYDAGALPAAPVIVAPLEEQDPLESRRAWGEVMAGIKAGDYRTVTREKNRIENEQRELRKKEKAEGKEWERRYFTKVDSLSGLPGLPNAGGLATDDYGIREIWVHKPVASKASE